MYINLPKKVKLFYQEKQKTVLMLNVLGFFKCYLKNTFRKSVPKNRRNNQKIKNTKRNKIIAHKRLHLSSVPLVCSTLVWLSLLSKEYNQYPIKKSFSVIALYY